jgi:hypothetical protein
MLDAKNDNWQSKHSSEKAQRNTSATCTQKM